jgi:nicotinamidase-related amidase
MLCLVAFWLQWSCAAAETFSLQMRSRDDITAEATFQETQIHPAKTLIVVIDMWDRHWCKTHSARGANMIPRMNETLTAARKLGIQVVMAPSDVLSSYEDYPQRAAMVAIPEHDEPPDIGFTPDPPPAGGDICECGPSAPCKASAAWTRQHPDLAIETDDLIADANNARELFNLCAERDIDTLFYVGVASNICVPQRAMGMLNMRRHGYRTFFVRDLVEAITANGLNPATRQPDPNFTPAKGSRRTECYLEQHVSPSIESRQLIAAAGLRPADKRPHVVFVIADDEYGTEKTLPDFAQAQLEPELRCTFLHANPSDRNDIPGLNALYDADAVVLSVRRRFLPATQMDHLERYLRAGKPLVAIRVSVSPFAESGGLARSADGQVVWQDFDREVLGCRYDFYDSKARESGSDVWLTPDAKGHPLAHGLGELNFHTPCWIYRVSPLEKDATVLLEGRWADDVPSQPVAWSRIRDSGGMFYTSLGHAEDFKRPAFTRMLKNAVTWALEAENIESPTPKTISISSTN